MPNINFNATDFVGLIVWQFYKLTEPPLLANLSDEDLSNMVQNLSIMEIAKYPCHTQTDERSIKLVTEASIAVCRETSRDGPENSRTGRPLLNPLTYTQVSNKEEVVPSNLTLQLQHQELTGDKRESMMSQLIKRMDTILNLLDTWDITAESTFTQNEECPIKKNIKEKRKLMKKWHKACAPKDKTK
ncbi:hypothetical protein ILUMI_09569 [Ignelater luminosus]|uniref:Uncharacterized protein n=1 Tax=Ignelater luminosus TaxID=2038154 RepID=A0A8K0D8W5_IGNLU|nr:hypothetical protein ILUMI_09569 [Ignelater luminosus]